MRFPLAALALPLLLLAPAAASGPVVVVVDWQHGFFVAGAGAGSGAADAVAGPGVASARFPFTLDGCHRTLYLDLLYDPQSAGGGKDANSVEVVYEWRAEVWGAAGRLSTTRILASSYGYGLGTYDAGPLELRVYLVVGANVTWGLRLRAWEVPAERACLPPVFINEVEANPAGVDAGNESVGLYNPNAQALDASGWVLRATHGVAQELTLPQGTLIPAQGFLRVQFTAGQFLDNEDETVELTDGLSIVLDSTPVLTDTANDGKTWQRTPDGGDSWAFRAGTLNATNG